MIKPKSQPTKPKPTKPKPQSAKSQSAKNQPANAGGGGKAASTKQNLPKKLIADNRKTRQHYEIIDSIECGMILLGSEVKSLRDGKLSLEEAYARVKDGEVWLVGADIAEYKQA